MTLLKSIKESNVIIFNFCSSASFSSLATTTIAIVWIIQVYSEIWPLNEGTHMRLRYKHWAKDQKIKNKLRPSHRVMRPRYKGTSSRHKSIRCQVLL